MTRKHWIDSAKYVLGRAFERHVTNIDMSMKFSKVAGKSYSRDNSPEWCYRSAAFECIRRTSYLGFPLIHVERDLTLNNIKLRDYYKRKQSADTHQKGKKDIFKTKQEVEYKVILADNTFKVIAMSLDKLGYMRENFHGETGEPLYADYFASWNILADLMLDYLPSGTSKLDLFL